MELLIESVIEPLIKLICVLIGLIIMIIITYRYLCHSRCVISEKQLEEFGWETKRIPRRYREKNVPSCYATITYNYGEKSYTFKISDYNSFENFLYVKQQGSDYECVDCAISSIYELLKECNREMERREK